MEKRQLVEPSRGPRQYTLEDDGRPHELRDFVKSPPSLPDSETTLIDRPMQTEKRRKTCATLTFSELQLVILLILATIIIILLAIVVVVLRTTSYYYCTSTACAKQAGVMVAVMNKSADPCNDFYNYACGNWVKVFTPTPGVGKYSNFYRDSVIMEKRLYFILNLGDAKIAHKTSKSANQAIIFYKACMDTKDREKQGTAPLINYINNTGGWTLTPTIPQHSSWDFIDVISKVMKLGRYPIMSIATAINPYKSTTHVVYLGDGDSFFSRGELLSTNPKYKNAFLATGRAFAKLLGATSTTDVNNKLEKIWALDKDLVQHRQSTLDARNPLKTNNIVTVDHLYNSILARKLNIKKLLRLVFNRNFKGSDIVLVKDINYWKYLGKKIPVTDSKLLANYIMLKVVFTVSAKLNHEFQVARSSMKKAISGNAILTPSWKLCVGLSITYFPLPLTALYVQKHFDKKTKKNVEKMVAVVKETLALSIKKATWMDEKTKKVAEKKVSYIKGSVAYPSYLFNVTHLDMNYKGVHLSTSTFFDDYITMCKHRVALDLKQLNKPVDRLKFSMAPLLANAYYSQNTVTIKILAGILQYPFYENYNLMQSNFGALGSVIGHELNHGFDSRGQMYDFHGNLRRWWSNETAKRFRKKTQCFINQYSKYYFHGLRNRGEITVAENMADNAGIQVSLKAYLKYRTKHQGYDGFLPGLRLRTTQLFYLSFAQMYCGYYTDAYAKHSVKTDVHSPYPHRVLGTLSNQKEFADVYNCPAGSKYNPKHRCVLW